jgi:hypothetical protein
MTQIMLPSSQYPNDNSTMAKIDAEIMRRKQNKNQNYEPRSPEKYTYSGSISPIGGTPVSDVLTDDELQYSDSQDNHNISKQRGGDMKSDRPTSSEQTYSRAK